MFNIIIICAATIMSGESVVMQYLPTISSIADTTEIRKKITGTHISFVQAVDVYYGYVFWLMKL